MRFLDPKNDIAFKKIFGDEHKKFILISFLNAILEKDIVDLEIVNPYSVPRLATLKYTVLDVKAKDRKGNEFIVEMQSNPQAFIDKRALDYISRAYSQQLKKGQHYREHKPVYFVGVLDFKHFSSKHFLSKHCILNMETLNQEVKDFELYFIELPKFKLKLNALNTILEKWVFFLKSITKYTDIPQPLKDIPEIEAAALTANEATWETAELDVYDYWVQEDANEKYLRDELEQTKNEIIKAKEDANKAKEDANKAKEDANKAKEDANKAKEDARNAESEKVKLMGILRNIARTLHKNGISIAEIAEQLSQSEEEIKQLLK